MASPVHFLHGKKTIHSNPESQATVLIVDDTESNRALLADLVATLGHLVVVAQDGAQGLACLRSQSIDLVLLDILMPEIDGFEVLTQMKADAQLQFIPVIVVSAIDDFESALACLEMGADDYVTKPFKRVLMRARINNCLAKKRLLDRDRQQLQRVQKYSSGLEEFVKNQHLELESIRQAEHEIEERFKVAVNTVVDGIVMTDERGTIQLANPAMTKLFGYRLDELVGHSVNKIMPEEHSVRHNQYMRHYLETGERKVIGIGRELVARRKDGSMFPIYLAVGELRSEQQRMFTGIIRDITDLKDAERALCESREALEIQNQAFSRFVPREFLSLLGKESIVQVQLGDQVQREMTIMFSDIREFTALSESMTPEDNFKFINSYLSRMEPIILQNNGFIDKYIGDSIMALFPYDADDAVRCGVAMQQELIRYNQERVSKKRTPIEVGIGVHTGVLMLGTIGGKNRMDGTVISDAVNLAARVESMTKIYGAPLLITEHTYNLLNDSHYAIRILDRVKVKGKTEPVIVFEVLNGECKEQYEAKLRTQESFTQALTTYFQKHFEAAEIAFGSCLAHNPADKASELYVKRCQFWQRMGVLENWDGISELDYK